MDKEELIKFLKENMRISVSNDVSYEYDNVWTTVGVTIYIGDEKICSDYASS